MKAKLLKKIRKRYSIFRYDQISTKPSLSEKEYKEKYGLPFYVLYDNESYFPDEGIIASDDLKCLIDGIKRLTIKQYIHKIKPSKTSKTKVWHNQ